jgi:hypothetical protein
LPTPIRVGKECRLEFDDGAGATLRVQLVGYDAADVEALAQLLGRPVILQITPQMKILVAVEPADFRRGIDGLARLCREALQQDPFAGTVFVFCNRKATSLKVLIHDGQGFWLCHERLISGSPMAASRGGHRRRKGARGAWPRTSWRACTPPATHRGRARRPTGGPRGRRPERTRP